MRKAFSRVARIGEELHTVAGQLAPVSKDGEACGFPWKSAVEFAGLPAEVQAKYNVSATARAVPWSGNRWKFDDGEVFEFSELPSGLCLFRRRLSKTTKAAPAVALAPAA